ncbi:hypothetical protein BOTBODRAFT_513055 [Botryobasidium botryosum FD-172 SS1]|uniref:Protein kinase domain-containing protein n=1 Tax=Botryobasidium botryosum (strain FD-172 SS1) TaxID=930990 RepID=A0A067MSB6_BOTB1|nr:hypothetical protein BOTBODRAFT_513055 [Botryobasidium botryosum FD-172 SS1]
MLHWHEVAKTKSARSDFGGFADCWEGQFLGRLKVAMKTLRSHLSDDVIMRRLKREMELWCKLKHPNILRFIGCYTMADTSYMVSPWMENRYSLAYIQAQGSTRPLELLVQVAKGLRYLHHFQPRPVIHGDLKSSNIFISENGDARIADFGLSQFEHEEYDENQSSAWHNGGNPRWQAPELFEEGARRTKATDIFAFGRVMLEFITGKIPFHGLSTARVVIKVMSNTFPDRPNNDDAIARGLDDDMWLLMGECWNADWERRPLIADIFSRLQRALEGRDNDSMVLG